MFVVHHPRRTVYIFLKVAEVAYISLRMGGSRRRTAICGRDKIRLYDIIIMCSVFVDYTYTLLM